MLSSKRVVLRDWRDDDLDPFAALNADARVMARFPAPLTRSDSDALAARIRAEIARRGWGLWALEVPGVASFAGFVGLQVGRFEARFTPAVEISWRLARRTWGHGYATEAARLALGHGFSVLGLDEIVSFTSTTNERSIAVMTRLGMHNDPDDDFDHPSLPEGHHLRRHVLYRLSLTDWERAQMATVGP